MSDLSTHILIHILILLIFALFLLLKIFYHVEVQKNKSFFNVLYRLMLHMNIIICFLITNKNDLKTSLFKI